MATEAEAPPSLVRYDPALRVDAKQDADALSTRVSKAKAMGAASDAQIDEIINSILPPRLWTQTNDTSFMQYVSKDPASRLDVLALQEQLEKRLMERQAREAGICPVRRELYGQCFDELIRQVTLESPERGLLLLRVRDELSMTMDAYSTLHATSTTFGVRKALQGEEGMAELDAEVDELQTEVVGLQEELAALRARYEAAERRHGEARALAEKKRKDTITYLKHQTQHLEAFLKQLPARR